jgi:endonuclease/exonuclease/phosphatase (EEP) superfamily protein YafD
VEHSNPEPIATLAAIDELAADLVLLQEITARWRDALRERFADRYPHHRYHLHTRPAGGLAVLSRSPIDADEILVSPEAGWFPAQRLVVDGLQILHVHLRPMIDQHGWLSGAKTTPPIRRREIEAHWAALVPMPTVVAGDHNEGAAGLAIEFLRERGLSRVAPEGPHTWRYVRDGKELLAFDLDHVLIDASLVARDARVIDAGTSDHRPVVATVEAR